MTEQASPDPAANAATGPWAMPPSLDHHAQRAYWRAQRRAARYADPAYRPGLVGGTFLVLVGALAILTQFIPSFDAGLIWAFAVLALGVLALARALVR